MQEFKAGISDCPKCNFKFKLKVDGKAKPGETNVNDLVSKLKEIYEGLLQTLRTLRKKIDKLETERASLFVEIEKPKESGGIASQRTRD